ncbi:MAG: fibronectin type III domain-containing protein [Ferruginibacter sp.]
MTRQKITTNFQRYTDSAFDTKAAHILNSMMDNPAFADPIPTLTELQIVLTSYSQHLVAAINGDKVAVAEKNKSRRGLERLLVQLGMYVMYVANGNVTILTSSGFTLAKQRETNYITNPGSVTLKNGITSGQLTGAVKMVKGVRAYLHQITDEPPKETTAWQEKPSSRCRYTFNNLVPGRQYWVRIAATASGNQIAYSAVSSQFVQ